MAESRTQPIQVFLDTQRLIQVQPTGTRGPNRDFFAGDNEGFRRHKAQIRKQLAEASANLRAEGSPAGFIMVQMREEGLAKSYRPLGALFTVPHRFALVGGAAIGQMYFQATPTALDELSELIEQKAEIYPRVVSNDETGALEERVSSYRSELGAIDEVRLPTVVDRLTFSANDAVSWLKQENVIGGYVVELFRPDPRVSPQAVEAMVNRFRGRLTELGGLIAVPFSTKASQATGATMTLSVDLRTDGQRVISLPLLPEIDNEISALTPELGAPAPDRSIARHQALLDFLSMEPLVRRIELPLRLESAPSSTTTLEREAEIQPPTAQQSYPIVGIVDAGVADIPSLRPWRAGGAGLIAANDRDESHGSFIAGLLAGASGLNPMLADRLEPIPCRHFDIDILPKRGAIQRYYQTPDEFFDQLETEVEAAKAAANVRIFNMSLGAPGVRLGLGYSSFAANLDRIAITHDVIFVVSAGNLRGLEARPEWPAGAEDALEMLATRAIAEERITAPGEHLYGLTVGAINAPGIYGVTADVPTTYSRRGPGPGGARKPELAHIGGISARTSSTSGLYSVGVDGRVVDGCGTSYATPLVTSSLAALDHRLDGQAPRETLLALGVHKATKPKILQAKPLRTVARDFVGFGVPMSAEACLADEPHSITLVFADILPPRRELSFVFTWPRSLTYPDGKCRGRVDVTLAHTPPVDAAFDAECQRVQLSAALYQLEERIDRYGQIIADPQQRLNACDSQLPSHLEYTERYLLESGLKWTPIKRYERSMPRGCGSTSEWRLSLRGMTRAGVIYPEEGVRFALLMTISDPKGAAPIYEEVRAEILRRGLRLADITVAQRLRTRG
ncbi:MAG TPA: S8 family peptidase [Microvirga sp.]|nr:S8 family peptidase [Microvirga sp.]